MVLIYSPILANSGLDFTMFMVGLPFFASAVTFGLGGIGIVLLEAWGLQQRESVSWRQAFWTSLWINLFSTFIGFLLAILYAGGALLVFITIFFSSSLLGWFLCQLRLRLLRERQVRPPSITSVVFMYFSGFVISFFMLILAGVLNSAISASLSESIFAISILLTLNFLLTWTTESYLLTRRWKEKSPAQLSRTVFWINIRSYTYVILPIVVLGGFFQRSWSW